VHFTEACDAAGPHVITQVETTPATTADAVVVEPIHTKLAAKDLLPDEHFVDSGYVSGEQLAASAQQQIRLMGPAHADGSWQARTAPGFATACFAVDWAAQQVTCPAGQRSRSWTPAHNAEGKDVIIARFDTATCRACPLRAQCTKAAHKGRTLTLRPQAAHGAITARRMEQETAEFKAAYAVRAGIEGTLAQGIRVCDLRTARYRGLAKTRLQQIIIAVAVSLLRVVAWLQERPRAHTRLSAFADLANWPALTRAAAGV
jgi:transposase